jgi:hypothetical protein
MRRFFENRLAFAATLLAFALAMGFNALYGAGEASAHAPALQAGDLAIIPTFPPCPTCDPPGAPPPPDGSPVAAVQIIPTFPPCPTCDPPPPARVV